MTGGAGFIGVQLRPPRRRAHRRHGHRARQAHLRRQPRVPRRPAPRPGPTGRRRRRRRRDRRPAGGRARRGGALRRRVAQRQLPRRPRALHPHQPGRHLRAARGGPAGTTCASTTSRPTRCTATSRSTTRSGSPRTRRTAPAARTPPPRPAPTTWCGPGCAASACGRRSPTAPTTTAPGSTSRSSSRARSPRCSRAAGRGCTATGARSATGSTPTTTARAVLAILERGRIGETYLVGADGERSNLEVVRTILRADGPRRGRLRAGRPTGPATTCATPSSPGSSAASWAGSRGTRTSSRAGRHDRVVRRPPRLVGSAQGGHRGGVRREGPVVVSTARPTRARPTVRSSGRAIPGLLVVRLDVRTRQPRLVRGGLAAGEDDRARAPRLRSGAGQPVVERRAGHDARHPRRAVGQARHGRAAGASSAPGSTSARATRSARAVTLELGPGVAVFVPRGVGNSFQTLEDATAYALPGQPALASRRDLPRRAARRPRRWRSPGRSPWRTPRSRRRTGSTRPSPTSSPCRNDGRSSWARTASSAAPWPRRSPSADRGRRWTSWTSPTRRPWTPGPGTSTTSSSTPRRTPPSTARRDPEGRVAAWAANAAAPAALARIATEHRLHPRALLDRLRLRRDARPGTPRTSR